LPRRVVAGFRVAIYVTVGVHTGQVPLLQIC